MQQQIIENMLFCILYEQGGIFCTHVTLMLFGYVYLQIQNSYVN